MDQSYEPKVYLVFPYQRIFFVDFLICFNEEKKNDDRIIKFKGSSCKYKQHKICTTILSIKDLK